MIRRYVDSTNVASVGYENGVLEVEFHKGGIYQYYNVSKGLYYEFMNAQSKGKFLNEVFKKQEYPYRKIA